MRFLAQQVMDHGIATDFGRDFVLRNGDPLHDSSNASKELAKDPDSHPSASLAARASNAETRASGFCLKRRASEGCIGGRVLCCRGN
jgi:hypothetical protein